MSNWKRKLGLAPHPEGGAFQEVFRSPANVVSSDGRQRSALTHIYFSLAKGEVSLFHNVRQDEVWNFYQGEMLRILELDSESMEVYEVILGESVQKFCHVVKAGIWQAAESLGASALCGCSVAPGFTFDDFQLVLASDTMGKHLIEKGYEKFVKKG